jgi:hypothetical protein
MAMREPGARARDPRPGAEAPSLPIAGRGACIDRSYGFETVERSELPLEPLLPPDPGGAEINLSASWPEFWASLRRLEQCLLAAPRDALRGPVDPIAALLFRLG